MSTQLANIPVIDGTLQVSQFGDKKHGLCVQLTCSVYQRSYEHLNADQARQLVRVLQDWLGETELFQGQMRRAWQEEGNPQEYGDSN